MRNYLQQGILRVLSQYPPDRFVSMARIAADLPGGRSPGTLASMMYSMRKQVESRKGPGGGYRLKRSDPP